MIVGEFPVGEEIRSQAPFLGNAGEELSRMLHEAGILRSDCFLVNTIRYRPPRNDITAFIYPKKTNPPAGFVHHFDKWVHPCVVEGITQLQADIAEV